MPRPNKIKEPTVTYNLLLPSRVMSKLQVQAHNESLVTGAQVSVADIIRRNLERTVEHE